MRTDAERAADVAARAAHTLRELRGLTTVDEISRAYAVWLDWARTNGVCQQIREHVSRVRADCERAVKADRAAVGAAMISRMIGEGGR